MTLIGRWLLAALVLLAGPAACSSAVSETPAVPSTSPTPPAPGCADAVGAAVAFFDAHPKGPFSVDEDEHALLAELVERVERRCSLDEVRNFGSGHLEPWSAAPDGPGRDGPSTKVPADAVRRSG